MWHGRRVVTVLTRHRYSPPAPRAVLLPPRAPFLSILTSSRKSFFPNDCCASRDSESRPPALRQRHVARGAAVTSITASAPLARVDIAILFFLGLRFSSEADDSLGKSDG